MKKAKIETILVTRYPNVVENPIVLAGKWLNVFGLEPIKDGDCDGDPEEDPVFNDFSDYIGFDVEWEE